MKALRIHVLASREEGAGGLGDTVTALCGKQGFKSAHGYQPPGEYQAMATLGGFRCLGAGDFYPGHDACARCKSRWTAGDGID